MNFIDQESATKLRGGYYTPLPVAKFLARWVAQSNTKTILEPSCGDGAFIEALSQVQTNHISLTGVELLKEEANKAKELIGPPFDSGSKIINVDFLEWVLDEDNSKKRFDGILGNPPYIRYQYLKDNDQALTAKIFAKHGLKFTKHTNLWVPFVISSINLLKPGSRLAMVVPSELLHVLHAQPLRQYLFSTCEKILLIDPNELLFEDALQGTVLLMLEKKKNDTDLSFLGISSMANNDFLNTDPQTYFDNTRYVSSSSLEGKWMKALLSPKELVAYDKLTASPYVKRFKDIASVDVGIVTGANKFFLVNNETVDKYKLSEYAQPMFGRSEHSPGIIYDERQHTSNSEMGLPVNFLNFGNTAFDDFTPTIRKYINEGEDQNLHLRYKCRIRKPWYKVPSIYATEIGMLKRSHNYPRLILNQARALTTDTAYRIRPVEGINAKILVYNFINSLTALSAEMEGRSYGGGVLEMVPSEIEKVLIPLPDGSAPSLKAIGVLDAKIRERKNIDELMLTQDSIIFKNHPQLANDLITIHTAWKKIRMRRQRLFKEIK
jgi:adenine-specific DNA methylase